MQCSVTIFSFGPNNVGQPKLHIAVKRRKQARPEMSEHPSSITQGEQDTSTGDKHFMVLFCFSRNTTTALGRCAVTDSHLVQPEEVIPMADESQRPRSSYSSLAGK